METELQSSTDYYPFGQPMPERNFNEVDYRFGFNGKENDNEVYGPDGSFQDYGMRMYDTRLGRFISVDPITKEYPELTPYQFASNVPIMGIDLDGKELLVAVDATILADPGHTILIVPDYKEIIDESGVVSYQIQGLYVYGTPYGVKGMEGFTSFGQINDIGYNYVPQNDIKDFFLDKLKMYDGIIQLTNKDISIKTLYNDYLVGGKKSLSKEQISASLKLNPSYVEGFATSPSMKDVDFSTKQEKTDDNGLIYGAFLSTINCAGFVSKILHEAIGTDENAGVYHVPDNGGHNVYSPNQFFKDLIDYGGRIERYNKDRMDEYGD